MSHNRFFATQNIWKHNKTEKTTICAPSGLNNVHQSMVISNRLISVKPQRNVIFKSGNFIGERNTNINIRNYNSSKLWIKRSFHLIYFFFLYLLLKWCWINCWFLLIWGASVIVKLISIGLISFIFWKTFSILDLIKISN